MLDPGLLPQGLCVHRRTRFYYMRVMRPPLFEARSLFKTHVVSPPGHCSPCRGWAVRSLKRWLLSCQTPPRMTSHDGAVSSEIGSPTLVPILPCPSLACSAWMTDLCYGTRAGMLSREMTVQVSDALSLTGLWFVLGCALLLFF